MSNEYCKNNPDDPLCKRGDFILPRRVDINFDPVNITFRRRPESRKPTTRKQPTVELQVPVRRKPTTELQVPVRRQPTTELQVPVRRQPTTELSKQIEIINKNTQYKYKTRRSDEPPPLLRGLSKKYNKKLSAFKQKQIKNLDLGLQESFETLEQHKYARLAQGAYDQSYKSKAKAMKGLKETGKYIPELNDFEIVPEFSNQNFTAYRNNVTGERHLAVRGSDADFYKPDSNIESLMKGKGLRAKNFQDWITNGKFAVGKHQSSERYLEGKNLLKSFAEAERIPLKNVTLSGHSLGGGLAKYLSRLYGGIAHVFNAASNPVKALQGELKIKDFHPESLVKSYRTYGDAVSLGEVVGDTEPQLEITNYTSLPGHETSVLGQHGLEEQFLPDVNDIELVGGKVKVKRTTKFRNIAGLTSGSVAEIGLKNALMAIPAVLLQPKYDTKSERTYRQIELGADLAKGAFEFEGGQILSKAVGGGGLPLNVSGTFADLWIGDLIHGADENEEGSLANKYHKLMKSIREPIFGKDAGIETGFKAPPTAIEKFNLMTKTLFGNSRYEADIERQKIQDMADAYGITYEEAFEMTPETDTGVPLANTEQGQDRFAKSDLQQQQLVSQDVETESGFTRGGKTYIEEVP